MSGQTEPTIPALGHESHAPIDHEWVEQFSKVMALAYGYEVNVYASDELPTSMTSVGLEDQKIAIGISTQLLARAEGSDALDWLGFNILHELGHAERAKDSPPVEAASSKDGYFANITEDIAINHAKARQTRFVADIMTRAYDNYLFPMDKRTDMAAKPKHQQFMATALILSMTTTRRQQQNLGHTLERIGLTGLAPEVTERLSSVVDFADGSDKTFNLLEQLRGYGHDIPYFRRVVAPIRSMYEELYEEDQQEATQNGSGEGDTSDGQSHDGAEDFDYSEAGGCQHTHTNTEQPQSGDQADDKPTPSEPDTSEAGEQPASDSDSGDEAADISSLGKEIAEKIANILEENPSEKGSDVKPAQLTPEQLAAIRKELGLDESDFASFMQTVNRYSGEIAMITELVSQLRRDRTNEFLAPSHEIAARGRSIKLNKLLGYLASGSNNPTPDIWKTPAFQETIEHEFDGADFYFACDNSVSMAGAKAIASAESSVVLSQGIQNASLESPSEIPPIRIQIQAFGAGDQMLCELTDTPTPRQLGTMYTALKNPRSNNTQVAGALEKITPEKGRLSVVLVLSDGGFHDEAAAISQGKRLEKEGAVIVQCVFGGAEVANLAESAKRINIASAQDLPHYLFNIMPELVEVLRSNHA
jgi:hypothetical protein